MKEYTDKQTGAILYAYNDGTYIADVSDVREDDLTSASVWLGIQTSKHEQFLKRAELLNLIMCAICAIAIVITLIYAGNQLMKLL